MTTQTVVVINDFGTATLDRRTRTSSRGTGDRFTISVKAEPILHDLNPLKLGELPARAMRDLMERQIKAIGERASESTLLKRKWAANALAAGAAWARQRWSGGRTGSKAPNQSDKLFNDSGRLAEGLEVRENKVEGTWTVNVTANRLDPRTFKDGEAGVVEMVRRLIELAPAVAGDVLHDQGFIDAVAQASSDAIAVLSDSEREAFSARRDAWLNNAATVYKTLLEPILLG